MDLKQLVHSETSECVIVDPVDGSDTDIVITVYGPSTKQYREAMRLIIGSNDEDDAELEALVKMTSNWKGIELDGKTLKYSDENAKKAYDISWAVRKQVIKHVLELKNFLPKR